MQSAAPAGYHTVSPFLMIEGAEAFIAFVQKIFDATVSMEPVLQDDGSIMHAQVTIGDSVIMLGEACAQSGVITGMLFLYVANPDDVFERAVAEGCKVVGKMEDQFWGDRAGGFIDAWGVRWWVARRLEDKV